MMRFRVMPQPILYAS